MMKMSHVQGFLLDDLLIRFNFSRHLGTVYELIVHLA